MSYTLDCQENVNSTSLDGKTYFPYNMSDKCLQFAPLSSAVHTGFWWELCQKKLDDYKLTDIAIDIHGFYCNGKRRFLTSLIIENQWILGIQTLWLATYVDCTMVNGLLKF